MVRRILARGRNVPERRRRSRFQLRNRVQCLNHTGRLISSSDVSTDDRRFRRCEQILQPFFHVVVVATCCLMIYSLPPCAFGGRVVAKRPCTVSARRRMCRLGQGRLTEDGKRVCCRSDRGHALVELRLAACGRPTPASCWLISRCQARSGPGLCGADRRMQPRSATEIWRLGGTGARLVTILSHSTREIGADEYVRH